jgi:hypothetical protein
MTLHMPELGAAIDAIIGVISEARKANDRKASPAAARKGAKQDRQVGQLLDFRRQLADHPASVSLTSKSVDTLRECLSIEVRRRKREAVEIATRYGARHDAVAIAYGIKEAIEDALDRLVVLDREMLHDTLFAEE